MNKVVELPSGTTWSYRDEDVEDYRCSHSLNDFDVPGSGTILILQIQFKPGKLPEVTRAGTQFTVSVMAEPAIPDTPEDLT